MTQHSSFDVIVIGAGPGGYVAAIRAAQLGFKTLCIDKRPSLGGTCLNVGCIPSKALLYSSEKYEEAKHHLSSHGIKVEGVQLDLQRMLERKDKIVQDLAKGIQYLFKKNGVIFVEGEATFTSSTSVKVKDNLYQASSIIIATGSKVASLPGIEIDEDKVVSSTGALWLKKVPERMVVIGGGYIGLELGSVWRRLGAAVTVIEYADAIVPAMDRDMGGALFKSLKQQGMNFELSSKVTAVKKNDSNVDITVEDFQGNVKTLVADIVLCCAGRQPFTEGLGLDTIGLRPDAKGCISVNEKFQTEVPSVYAIGDVIQGPMLAHKAEEEGVAVAEILAGQKPHINYSAIPAVIYTLPEVASVGWSEEELKKQGKSYKVGKFPFLANSRGRTTGQTEGLVKILADSLTDEVYGVHIIHETAGTMIAEAVLALEYRASAEDIARTCHAHPTFNEAIREAALGVHERSIHI